MMKFKRLYLLVFILSILIGNRFSVIAVGQKMMKDDSEILSIELIREGNSEESMTSKYKILYNPKREDLDRYRVLLAFPEDFEIIEQEKIKVFSLEEGGISEVKDAKEIVNINKSNKENDYEFIFSETNLAYEIYIDLPLVKKDHPELKIMEISPIVKEDIKKLKELDVEEKSDPLEESNVESKSTLENTREETIEKDGIEDQLIEKSNTENDKTNILNSEETINPLSENPLEEINIFESKNLFLNITEHNAVEYVTVDGVGTYPVQYKDSKNIRAFNNGKSYVEYDRAILEKMPMKKKLVLTNIIWS